MSDLNKVMIIGRLGRDPEVRYTTDGKTVATFSVAAGEKWEGGEHTEWFNVVTWAKLAEICQKYLHKGSQVYIEGKLRTREWEGRDQQKRKQVEVIANQMIMLGGGGGSVQGKQAGESGQAQTSSIGFAGNDLPDDGIPF
jgi:single-strand DNA-binding protein